MSSRNDRTPPAEPSFDGLEFFWSFSPEQREQLRPVVRSLDFAAGEVLYREESNGHDFLLIQSGKVEAIRSTPFGDQRVATLETGELCGEISLLDGMTRSTSIVAAESGRALLFDGTALRRLTAVDRAIELLFLQLFCRSLVRKIRQANVIMTEIMAPESVVGPRNRGTTGRDIALAETEKRTLLRRQGEAGPDLEELATFLTAQQFAAGEPIFVEGESGDTLYIIADGRVRISRHIPGLGEEAITILDQGEVFGEMAWIDDKPRSADAIAHTGGCTVLGITRQQLQGTLEARDRTQGDFLRLLCQILSARIRNMNHQLVAYRTLAFF